MLVGCQTQTKFSRILGLPFPRDRNELQVKDAQQWFQSNFYNDQKSFSLDLGILFSNRGLKKIREHIS